MISKNVSCHINAVVFFALVRYATPWHKGHQQKATGTGICIGGKRILTNSHVVHEHTVVRVRRPGSTTKFVANVKKKKKKNFFLK